MELLPCANASFKASLIAASGPIAFATSFAPCAKLKSAAAKISGIVKRLLISSFLFSILSNVAWIKGFTIKNVTIPTPTLMHNAIKGSTLTTRFKPLLIKYKLNANAIKASK